MSSRREIVSWILIGIALISIGIGYIKLDDNQGQIRQESRNRVYGACLTAQFSREGLRSLVKFATEPTPTEGFTGDLLKAKEAANVQRAVARVKLLEVVPPVVCHPNGAEKAKVDAEFRKNQSPTGK